MKEKLKTRNINIRVTEAEYEKINQFAASFNLPTGMYLRMLGLLGYLPIRTTQAISTVLEGVQVTGVREKRPAPLAAPKPARRQA